MAVETGPAFLMFRPWVWLLLLIGMVGWLAFGGDIPLLSLDGLKAHYAALMEYRLDHPRLAALLYFTLYLTVTSLSVPGVIVLSVAGGALFGLVWGTMLASFASTLGGTLAFLAARHFFRDGVRQRWGQRLAVLDAGLVRDGPFYLFGMRLIPVLPYFLINLLMGLTPISTTTFYWISQLGMLPLLMIYVNAGVQLTQLDSLQGLFSPALLLALGLLAVFPLLARGAVALLARGRCDVGGDQHRSVPQNEQPTKKRE